MKKIKTFEPNELWALYSECVTKAPRTALYLLLMANCGMYQNDISELGEDEVDFEAGTITRPRSKTPNGPVVKYKLWPETLVLLKKFRHKDEKVLNERGAARVLVRSRATIISTSDVDRIGLRCHGRQMKHATVVPVIRSKYEALAPLFNEHQRRLWAASEARVLGYGGIALWRELPDWIAIPSPLGCGNWTTPRQRIPSTVSAGPVRDANRVRKSTRGCWLLWTN